MDFSKSILASFLSGLLFVFCYAPYDLWPLSFFALIPLMVSVQSASFSRTILSYSITGMVLGVGIYYGAIGYGIGALFLIVFAFVFAFALWGGLTRWMFLLYPTPALKIFAPALLWVGIETLIGNSPLGVPMYLGLSHAMQPWLIQSASWFGISGISFIIVLGNSLFTYILISKKNKWVTPVFIASLILFANPLFGYLNLANTSLPPATIKVAAIQPLISSETYTRGWQQPENRVFMHNTLYSLTQQAVESGAQMVFWAEGGNGHLNMRIPALRKSLSSIARKGKVDLIISSGDMDKDGTRFNSLFSITPSGQLLDRYDKRRLLPMAEAHLNQGVEAKPLLTSRGALGAVICYESTFPEPLRDLTSQGAKILFVTSSEAAFKRSPLALHNAGLAVFRAIENNRWLVRAANTGPSIIVSPRGEVVATTGFYSREILLGKVSAIREFSFFTRAGYLLPKALALLVIGLVVYILFVYFSRSRKPSKRVEPLRGRVIKILPPFVFSVFLLAVTISISISSSLYMINREALNSQFTVNALLAELFYPAYEPQIDTVGKEFLQAGNNTCGAAALAYVLSFLGRETEENEIVKMVKLSERGTSMLELKNAATQLQFSAVGVSANYAALSEEPLPVIAYINNDHYVVVISVNSRSINVFDPALGYVRLAKDLFEQSWNGYLLLVHPSPIPIMLGENI